MATGIVQEPERRAVNGQKLLRTSEVLRIVPVTRQGLHKFVKRGQFPPPIRIGNRGTCWIEAEVIEWLEQAKEERKHDQ